MIRLRHIWLLLLATVLAACGKSELQPYIEAQMVYFYKPRLAAVNPDSLTYSFAVRDAALAFDTVRIPLRIMGAASAKDRTVRYSVITDRSTIDSENFELLPAVIKANSFTGEVVVKVLRTDELKLREMKLWLRIEQSEDFKTGVDNQLEYLVKVNDFLSMPSSWLSYFGKYSNTKYDLIIKATGRYDYSGVQHTEAEYLTQLSVNYLIAWEEANGPLIDENGDRVFFP